MSRLKKRVVLYVDDDSDDRDFLEIAVSNYEPETKVILANNGLQAMSYLIETKSEGKNLPCLIILDLNMPLMDGRQTYARIKSDPSLITIPVVILTTSYNPTDKEYFNKQGVDLITKPNNVSKYDEIVKNILRYCK